METLWSLTAVVVETVPDKENEGQGCPLGKEGEERRSGRRWHCCCYGPDCEEDDGRRKEI